MCAVCSVCCEVHGLGEQNRRRPIEEGKNATNTKHTWQRRKRDAMICTFATLNIDTTRDVCRSVSCIWWAVLGAQRSWQSQWDENKTQSIPTRAPMRVHCSACQHCAPWESIRNIFPVHSFAVQQSHRAMATTSHQIHWVWLICFSSYVCCLLMCASFM